MARKLLPENINIQSIEDSWEEGIIQYKRELIKQKWKRSNGQMKECVRKDEWTKKKENLLVQYIQRVPGLEDCYRSRS